MEPRPNCGIPSATEQSMGEIRWRPRSLCTRLQSSYRWVVATASLTHFHTTIALLKPARSRPG